MRWRRALVAPGLVLGWVVGYAFVFAGAVYASTVDDHVASASDQRTGAALLATGIAVASALPVRLALRHSPWWWLPVAAFPAWVAWALHGWPPVLDWTF